MHKYLIELTKYTQAGALTNEYSYDTADTPQGLADKVAKWNKMRYTVDDGEGNITVGGKMYRVVPKQGVYEAIADFDEFVSVNAVEYHA